jgi:hypothetical protein
VCVCVCVCMSGFRNVWVSLRMSDLVICVLVFTMLFTVVLCFCIFWFMDIYSYLFYLDWCKDYCHRVTTVCTGVRTTATE